MDDRRKAIFIRNNNLNQAETALLNAVNTRIKLVFRRRPNANKSLIILYAERAFNIQHRVTDAQRIIFHSFFHALDLIYDRDDLYERGRREAEDP